MTSSSAKQPPVELKQTTQPVRPEQDEVSPSNDKKRKKPLSFYFTFLALNICVLLVSLDATALSVAVPVITHELNGTTLEAFWASLCFLLAVVAVMPIITSLSDVLGRKIPLYASFIIFMIGSIVFAVANSMGILILGRALQGLGGGGLDVLGEVILADITTLKERPLYLGLFSIPMAGGAICGPIVGAALAEYASWRWIGWINLPLGVIGFLLFFFFLRLKPIESALNSKLARLDWTGMALFLVGSILFSLPLSWAGAMYPWASYQTLVPFILGLLFLTGFALYEARPVQPVFPYRIFSNRTSSATLVGAFMHGAVLNGGLLYLLLSFQATFRDTPFRSAIEVLPICVFIVIFSIVGAVSVEVLRVYKILTMAAWPCLAVGVGLFALWKPGVSDGIKYGPQVLAGVGLGVLFTICTFPMNASQQVDDAGLAIGIMVSFRMFGSMTGLAIGSTVFHSIFEQRIAKLGQLPSELAVLHDVREAIGFIPSLRTTNHSLPAYDGVIEAYRVSFMAVFLALAGMGAVGFLFSFAIKELSLESEEVGRQGFEED
ncbi:MFS general substrate transporter [Decorospora gaudefroyi]|uniref:MFS general substrate transporter n=1 Tax=Decorospora gaudefroyi TaxID=184978 RepID=A0A6A5JYX5_9PLEO|nr:MFS general substrate transporter [Decorospora gaudefroyi]